MRNSEIQARREKVAYQMVKGMPEAKIAELLGVCRNTIVSDVAHIRQGARDRAESVAQRIQILGALDENVKLYLELLGETPAVHAYRRALKKLEERSGAQAV